MNVKISRRTFVASTLALGVTGKFSAPAFATPTGTLRVAYGSLGQNRHPHSISNLPDTDIANLIFDPLFTRNANGEIEYVLAESLETMSPTVLRMRIRRGVQFHDGRPLTSADVKYSLENYLSPETTNRYLYVNWLARVEILDDHTVDIVSTQPFRLALPNMAYLSFIIPNGSTVQEMTRQPIGSGPYSFASFIPNDRVVVNSNANYWGKAPRFETITLRQITEAGIRAAALQAGEIDFASGIAVEDVPILEAAKFQVATVTTYRTIMLRYNEHLDGPLRDPRVRKALNHAIDRTTLREGLLGGLGADATSPLPEGIRFRSDNLEAHSYNPKRARELLAEAGYPNGFEIAMATPNGRYYKDREISEAIVGMLEEVGIGVELTPLEWATYLQQVRSDHTTYALSMLGWGILNDDPDFMMSAFDANNTAWNYGGYKNPSFQNLMKAGWQPADDATLQQIYEEAQHILWDDEAALFLINMPSVDAFRPQLTGYKPRRDEHIRWNGVSLGGE